MELCQGRRSVAIGRNLRRRWEQSVTSVDEVQSEVDEEAVGDGFADDLFGRVDFEAVANIVMGFESRLQTQDPLPQRILFSDEGFEIC